MEYRMKSNFLCSLFTLGITLTATASYAADCYLNGVSFDNLTQTQITAMKSAGAECNEKNREEFTFGKEGYFVIDGKRTDAIDVAASFPSDLMGKKATFYGYIGYYLTEKSGSMADWRFDTDMDAGSPQKGFGGKVYVNSGDNRVDLLFKGNLEDGLEETKKKRAAIYKTLIKAKEYNAAVKITGTFSTFRNTNGLYMRGNTVDIIQLKTEQ